MRSGYVDANGLRIHYLEAGDPANPDVLVLLHGGTETAAERWERVMPAFATDFRVLVPDTRGHGETGNDSRVLSYRLLADDTAAFCAALGISGAFFCGFSDGANTILELAMRHPALVRAGVLHGCIVEFTPAYEDAIRAFLATVPPDLAATVGPLWLTPPDYSDGDYAAATAPLLVIGGDRDEFVTVEQQQELHRRLAGSEFIEMPGTGHHFPADIETYADRITVFLVRRGG